MKRWKEDVREERQRSSCSFERIWRWLIDRDQNQKAKEDGDRILEEGRFASVAQALE
jgi:hypothetical protein